MKKTYIVTALAGREVAGMRTPGAGKPIQLTASQAEHPMRLGYITERKPVEKKPVLLSSKAKK